MEPTSLQALIELATAARDGAIAHATELRGHLALAQTQLATLRRYANEYQVRASTQARTGLDAATQSNWRAFDGKLEAAIAQQNLEIERRQKALDAAQAELVQMQQRLKSLQALAQRQDQAARLKSNRLEQKRLDELSARRASAPQLSGLGETQPTQPALHW
ncbi:MAG TPA: flagellar export protein FliJ [Burkholderiaceae bacterium]|nr:flagellar export protein FliJ [Burkholderiaceae bacterium]